MLWLEPIPWVRWALVTLVAITALYVELRPDPSVPHPFAIQPIEPGEVIDGSNTEMKRIPPGLFESSQLGQVATRKLDPGSPILPSDSADPTEAVPPGWWVVPVSLPDGATPGARVRLVLLDSGEEVDGVVAHAGSDDPFAAADGGVAVPPERSAAVAVAAANGRLAALISTG